MAYFCEHCNYRTNLLANFKRHCQTNKHLKNIHAVHNFSFSSSKSQLKKSTCEFCKKEFNSRSSKSRHIKYFCHVKSEMDNDKQEIGELLKQIKILQNMVNMNNLSI
jgi:chaperonin GroEL (HSP60 family)